jgi:hypothetical protein
MLPYSRDAELVFRVAGHPVEFGTGFASTPRLL